MGIGTSGIAVPAPPLSLLVRKPRPSAANHAAVPLHCADLIGAEVEPPAQAKVSGPPEPQRETIDEGRWKQVHDSMVARAIGTSRLTCQPHATTRESSPAPCNDHPSLMGPTRSGDSSLTASSGTSDHSRREREIAQ